MYVTVEMSLYPLTNDYEGPIIGFIQHLQKTKGLIIRTTSMSTYVKGEGSLVFDSINKALEIVDNQGLTTSLVIKVINRDLPVEQGFLEF